MGTTETPFVNPNELFVCYSFVHSVLHLQKLPDTSGDPRRMGNYNFALKRVAITFTMDYFYVYVIMSLPVGKQLVLFSQGPDVFLEFVLGKIRP